MPAREAAAEAHESGLEREEFSARPPEEDAGEADDAAQPMRSLMTTFSSRPGPTPITLIRAPESSSSRRT